MFSGYFSGIYQAIVNWLRLLWKMVGDAVWWFIETVRLYLWQFFEMVLSLLPDTGALAIGNEIKSAFYLADYWLGLGDIFVWLISYWIFAIVFAVVKFCIKLIPTVG